MLEAPPTLRVPRIDEIPPNPEVFERLKVREAANIVEGFKLNLNTTHDLPFKFYSEININNSRLWTLFKALASHLPDMVSCIYNLYEEESTYSAYSERSEVLKLLCNYETELTQDCNLEFGLIFHTKEKLEEVFVSDSKFIKFWGCNEALFRQTMNEFQLSEIPNLNFFDEFPKVVEPLTSFNQNVKETGVVISELKMFLKPKKKSWKFW